MNKINPKLIVIGIIIIFILSVVFSSFFTVPGGYQAIVLRLGRMNRLIKIEGLHFKLPFGIEKVVKENVKEVRVKEYGYKTEDAGVWTTYSQEFFPLISLMVTGDLNIIDVQWSLLYEISDLYKYKYRFQYTEKTIDDVSRSVLGEIIGDSSISEILTYGKNDIKDKALKQIRSKLEKYDCGIHVIDINFNEVNPPAKVKPSYDEENFATQEKETMINEAMQKKNEIIPKAEGEALQIVQQANAYKIRKINEALGKADRFKKIYTEYVRAPRVTKQRLYLETLKAILPKLDVIIVDGNPDKILIPSDLEKVTTISEGAAK